jgi:Tol biopolymer transport system component
MPSWSPDGKTIAYWRTEKKLSGVLEPTLELIDAEGHAKPRRLLHLTDLGQRRPEWSRDSRTLLVSHDFSEIWLVPVRAGSSPRKLATGSEADWKG